MPFGGAPPYMVLCLPVLVAACGTDPGSPAMPDPGPISGLARDKEIVQLTSDERIKLCDWSAGRFGGYGRTVTCADGTYLASRESQDRCVADWTHAGPQCSLTVRDLEDCTNGMVSRPTCQTIPAACFAIIPCG
jgi:hypothetical protein